MNTLRVVSRWINWAVLAAIILVAFFFILGDDSLNEGNSVIATGLVVLALTGAIWVPVGLIAAVVSLWLESRRVTNSIELLKQPAPYVLAVMMWLVSVIFI